MNKISDKQKENLSKSFLVLIFTVTLFLLVLCGIAFSLAFYLIPELKNILTLGIWK